MNDALHVLSQALLPVVAGALIVLAAYAVFCVGSALAEYFTERRFFKVNMPRFLKELDEAAVDDVPAVIGRSETTNAQRICYATLWEARTMDEQAHVALAKRLIGREEARYATIVGRTNGAAKIAPMLGLMGTLIPLGPGIAALGSGDTALLSASLLIAFDTTVAGLAIAIVALFVSKFRKRWYADYIEADDAVMTTLLEKAGSARAAARTAGAGGDAVCAKGA